MSQKAILAANDESLTSTEIARMLGVSPRYVRKVRTKLNLPRPGVGAAKGVRNHQYVAGRRIDRSGYAIVSAPARHPYQRSRPGRRTGIILEHRLVMERQLGRYLLPAETVDHIDGLTLHNCPSNLRLFASNADHLRHTITGQPHNVSPAGMAAIQAARRGEDYQPVDTYRQRKARGEIRLHQILRAALSLGIDSPSLLGTHRHLRQAGIVEFSRPTLERALDDLYQRWGLTHVPCKPVCCPKCSQTAP